MLLCTRCNFIRIITDINNLKSILHFIRFSWWIVLIPIYISYTANTTFSWYTHILLLRCDIHSVKLL